MIQGNMDTKPWIHQMNLSRSGTFWLIIGDVFFSDIAFSFLS